MYKNNVRENNVHENNVHESNVYENNVYMNKLNNVRENIVHVNHAHVNNVNENNVRENNVHMNHVHVNHGNNVLKLNKMRFIYVLVRCVKCDIFQCFEWMKTMTLFSERIFTTTLVLVIKNTRYGYLKIKLGHYIVFIPFVDVNVPIYLI